MLLECYQRLFLICEHSRVMNALQAFQSRVPHTARKSSNVELRLEKILDQEGLLPELQEIRSHKYRDEVRRAH